MLAADVESFTARDEQLESWTCLEELRYRPHRMRQLLEVVEEQEHGLVAKSDLQGLEERLLAGLGHANDLADGGKSRFHLSDGGQVDEEHAVEDAFKMGGRRAERQARLAGPTWAGQRDQTGPVVREQPADLLKLLFATNEGRCRYREVARAVIERPKRGEIRNQVRMCELEQSLGVVEVSQAIFAEIDEARPIGKLILGHG